MTMFVIIVYDAGQARDRKMLNVCRRYLNHVQKSVFEGSVSDSAFRRLKDEIKDVLNVKEDSCVIYCAGNTKYCRREKLGYCPEIPEDLI